MITPYEALQRGRQSWGLGFLAMCESVLRDRKQEQQDLLEKAKALGELKRDQQ